jgi:hypothetical protein
MLEVIEMNPRFGLLDEVSSDLFDQNDKQYDYYSYINANGGAAANPCRFY